MKKIERLYLAQETARNKATELKKQGLRVESAAREGLTFCHRVHVTARVDAVLEAHPDNDRLWKGATVFYVRGEATIDGLRALLVWAEDLLKE